jgi:hypothetical protein
MALLKGKNQSLKRAMRRMLLDAGLPDQFWGRAALTAAHLLNRRYSSYTPDYTPYELMWGVKPDVSHIRAFGSVCYPLVQPASKRIGAPKIASSVGIMVGYSDESAGVVVWDPIKKNLKICRDVALDENWRFSTSAAPIPLSTPNPALSYSMTPPHQLTNIGIVQHIQPIAQPILASRYVVEFCCGTSSALRYHLESDPDAQVLGIDILPYNSVARYIPPQHRSRFTYIQADVSSMSRLDLVNIVHNAWNITLDRIDHYHGSPPCETYSDAHHSKNFHRSGLIPLTGKATDHDRLNDNLCKLFHTLSLTIPALYTMENPTSC